MEIKYVASLGTLCHTANFLKTIGFKLESYPFDWIFSNQNTVIDCIEDDFKKFLDKTYYIDISKTKCGHSLYDKRLFNHRNPLMSEQDYEYYMRCCDRFKHLLQQEEHKLFIIMFINMTKIDENIKNNIIDFNNKLSKYTNNYTLLVIFNLSKKPTNDAIFTYNENIHFLELHTTTISNGLGFASADDNKYMSDIIKSKYTFNLNPVSEV